MTGQKLAAEVTVKCYYYAAGSSTSSLLSDPVSVTVLGKKFTTSVDLIYHTDLHQEEVL